jgi:hypothetical protein
MENVIRKGTTGYFLSKLNKQFKIMVAKDTENTAKFIPIKYVGGKETAVVAMKMVSFPDQQI